MFFFLQAEDGMRDYKVTGVQTCALPILLIDESYNANPASMAATLASLGAEKGVARRIAVLGPMRELGAHSDELHAGLAPVVLPAGVDRLILIGDEMRDRKSTRLNSSHL